MDILSWRCYFSGAYGLDIGSSLTKLLSRLLSLPLREEVMLRVGMGNPPFLLGQLAAASELLGHPNMFEFLQLPVQSGSNVVLSRMVCRVSLECVPSHATPKLLGLTSSSLFPCCIGLRVPEFFRLVCSFGSRNHDI